MKTYHGDAATETVTVEDHSTGVVSRLPHYVRHSPDGFLWGYGGSGPAELARCLIIDALGSAAWEHGERNAAGDTPNGPFQTYGVVSSLVELTYQAFKEQVIARLDRHKDWTLTQNRVLTFVRQEAELLGVPVGSQVLGAPA